MCETVTRDEVREAVEQLAKSRKGVNALRHLLEWFEDDALSLDMHNQRAVVVLLTGAWSGYPGSVREWMAALDPCGSGARRAFSGLGPRPGKGR